MTFDKDEKKNWILFALVFIVPLQNVYIGKIPALVFGGSLLNLLILIVFLNSLVNNSTDFKSRLTIPLICFSVTYIISWITSGIYIGSYASGSIHFLKDILTGFSFYFLVYKSCSTTTQLKNIFWATALPIPYMFKVYQSNLSWMGFSSYSDKLRLNGGTFTYLGSNEINAFYATYSFVLLAVGLAQERRWARWLLISLSIMNFYCVVYGFSRGAYIGVLVGGIVFCIVHSRIRWLVFSLLLLLLLSAIGVKTLPTATIQRWNMAFTDEKDRDKSAESRVVFWKLAFDYYLENPIVGIGYQNFPKINPAGLDTHNYFIKVMVENGTIGIVALLFFLARCWCSIKFLLRKARDPFFRALAMGMIPCMISLLIGNMFGDRFTHYPLIAYFFVYMAIIARGIDITERELVCDVSRQGA